MQGKTSDRDPDRWARGYAVFWAIALLAGMLLPWVFQRSFATSGHEVYWFWDMLAEVESEMALALVAAVGMGLLGLVAGLALRGGILGHTLLWPGVAICVFYFVVFGSSFVRSALDVSRKEAVVPVLAMLLLLLGPSLIASGNHLRKRDSSRASPRVLAGVGGVMVLIGFSLPIADRGKSMLIEAFFKEDIWDGDSIGFALCLLAFFAYGLLGVVALARGRLGGVTTATSLLARLILVAAPLVTAIGLSESSRRDFDVSLLLSGKSLVPLYGFLALIGVGIAAVFTDTPSIRKIEAEYERRHGAAAP